MSAIADFHRLTDSDLLDICLARRDRNAYAVLVERYQGLLCSLAYNIVGDFGESEDVAQETFLTAWSRLSTLRDRTKWKSWLCGIARHHALAVVKKRKPECSLSDDQPSAEDSSEPFRGDEAAVVWSALEAMPDTYREPLILYYREEKSVARVAEDLDLSESAVKQRLSRGRGMLRKRVKDLVENTLTQTKPGKTFTLAVMGALPGVLAGSAAAATAGTAGKATAGVISAAGSGALLGTLGGLLGGGFGMFMGHQTSRYASQRKFIVRSGILLFSVIGLLLLAGFLQPRYAKEMGQTGNLYFWGGWMILFFSFIFGWSIWVGLAAKRITKQAEQSGEPELPLNRTKHFLQKFEGRRWESKARLLGWPLVSIAFGNPDRDFCWTTDLKRKKRRTGTAKGWIAIGDRAIGCIALGNITMGGIAIGAVSVGAVSIGGVAAGGIAFGGFSVAVLALAGLAVGWAAIGGMAAGWLSYGGAAFGWKAAQGGLACANEFAVGGSAHAQHANDEAAKAFMEGHWFYELSAIYLKVVQSGVFVPALWIAMLALVGLVLGLGIRRKTSDSQL